MPLDVPMELQMFRWITSPRESRESTDSAREPPSEENDAMGELMVGEVEAAVYEFESQQETRRSEVSLQTRVPDYSWLIATHSTHRPKKYLTMQERSQLQRACELIRPVEWGQLSSMWQSRHKKGPRTRDHIISSFVQSVNEIVGMRPRPQTVSSVLTRYIRSQSSINAVSCPFSIQAFFL